MGEFLERLTNSAHTAFIESLDSREAAALRDLLLLASLADDVLTPEERVDIAGALGEIPGLSGTLDFETSDLIDHIDTLFARHEQNPDEVLGEILERLGPEDSNRRHAFRLITHVVSSDGLEEREEQFLRRFAARCGIEDEVVEFALSQARGG